MESDPIGLKGGLNTYAYAGGDPVDNADPLGLWSISVGGYLGAGVVVTFGSDNGSRFLTLNVGLGAGLDVSYNPDGGVPGGTPAASESVPNLGNGIVISDEADADVEVGPIDVGGAAGAYRNYTTDESGVYAGPGASGTVHWGIDVGATVNGQVTLYNPYKPPQTGGGCE